MMNYESFLKKKRKTYLHFSCLVPVNREDGLKSIPVEL